MPWPAGSRSCGCWPASCPPSVPCHHDQGPESSLRAGQDPLQSGTGALINWLRYTRLFVLGASLHFLAARILCRSAGGKPFFAGKSCEVRMASYAVAGRSGRGRDFPPGRGFGSLSPFQRRNHATAHAGCAGILPAETGGADTAALRCVRCLGLMLNNQPLVATDSQGTQLKSPWGELLRRRFAVRPRVRDEIELGCHAHPRSSRQLTPPWISAGRRPSTRAAQRRTRQQPPQPCLARRPLLVRRFRAEGFERLRRSLPLRPRPGEQHRPGPPPQRVSPPRPHSGRWRSLLRPASGQLPFQSPLRFQRGKPLQRAGDRVAGPDRPIRSHRALYAQLLSRPRMAGRSSHRRPCAVGRSL